MDIIEIGKYLQINKKMEVDHGKEIYNNFRNNYIFTLY